MLLSLGCRRAIGRVARMVTGPRRGIRRRSADPVFMWNILRTPRPDFAPVDIEFRDRRFLPPADADQETTNIPHVALEHRQAHCRQGWCLVSIREERESGIEASCDPDGTMDTAPDIAVCRPRHAPVQLLDGSIKRCEISAGLSWLKQQEGGSFGEDTKAEP